MDVSFRHCARLLITWAATSVFLLSCSDLKLVFLAWDDVDGDGCTLADGDCDDENPSRSGYEKEVCDGIDNNCDGAVDEGLLSSYYQDSDDDSFGNARESVVACDSPEGYVVDAADCNDGDPDINPGAPEVCDRIDNDCNGLIDEGVATMYYVDGDRDGYGSSDVGVEACTAPPEYVAENGDCNDDDPAINPSEAETCDWKDNNCNGETDEGLVRAYYMDWDSDGYGDQNAPYPACAPPTGYVDINDSGGVFDCNDRNENVNPGAPEACNDVDDDCDGNVNEGLAYRIYYVDEDGDGFGEGTRCDCTRQNNYSDEGGDCDDTELSVYPGADDECNGRDDDCNGIVDDNDHAYYFNHDNDAYPDSSTCNDTGGDLIGWPPGALSDCDDENPEVRPGATEICNGIDDNCNGLIDDAQDLLYQDADGDGYPGKCSDGPEAGFDFFVELYNQPDCDDGDSTIHPYAIETPDDGVDQNCDGVDGVFETEPLVCPTPPSETTRGSGQGEQKTSSTHPEMKYPFGRPFSLRRPAVGATGHKSEEEGR